MFASTYERIHPTNVVVGSPILKQCEKQVPHSAEKRFVQEDHAFFFRTMGESSATIPSQCSKSPSGDAWRYPSVYHLQTEAWAVTQALAGFTELSPPAGHLMMRSPFT